ncbi:MAG: 2-C-methyl-D-erythritol 2,4-cyclodiphosphate synthase [Veillonella sp.]|nr:2-C-methyl-D-erythritol 2,4-cyclodiphosphate synthase [Veillonella sp.]
MRVGFGYDIHRFKEGRPCILGGVTIESPIGPDGHSDADVLIHALMDAMLGAAGIRDIGYYFPPEDDQYKGISSVLLLEKVNSLLKEQGLQAYNIDVMVIAEVPKLKPHIEEMKANLQRVLEIPLDRISIKATTNEMLGALGRREGIAAQAVVTLYEGEV